MKIICKENPEKWSKKCRVLRSALKGAFSHCSVCNRHRFSWPSRLEEETTTAPYFDDVVVSTIRSKAMEAKLKRKKTFMKDSFFFYSDLKVHDSNHDHDHDHDQSVKQEAEEEEEDYMSVASHFSPASTVAIDSDPFFTVKTGFSRCSSPNGKDLPEIGWLALDGLDWPELRWRSVMQEFCHCEGWPFGLYKKALLLPPLPKSPSDSWTWCKKH